MSTFHAPDSAGVGFASHLYVAKLRPVGRAGYRMWSVIRGRFDDGLMSFPADCCPPEAFEAVLLGFHLKGIDVISAIWTLGEMGSFGTSMVLTRTLFETLVNMRFIMVADREERMKRFAAHTIVRTYNLALKDFRSAESQEQYRKLADAFAQRAGVSNRSADYRRSWSGANLEEMAKGAGLGHIYNNLYRALSQAAHGLDVVDVYNPAYHWNMHALNETGSAPQNFFFSNYALLNTAEIFGNVVIAEALGWLIFAETARFFRIPLVEDEEAGIKRAERYYDRTQGSYDFSLFDKAVEEMAQNMKREVKEPRVARRPTRSNASDGGKDPELRGWNPWTAP